MEALEKFGSAYQKQVFLEPLLQGEVRSCFAMTEPGVASSDATQIATRIEREPGGTYSVRGHKFFISGALRAECKFALVLGKSLTGGSKRALCSHALRCQRCARTHISPHSADARQTMIIVPMDHPGVKIIRAMAVFGHEHDHAEMIFDCTGVPAANVILGEGRGFEIAQGRLGPGRIHHCMRTIGVAEMALEAMIYRAKTRVAFGGPLAEKDGVKRAIAEARIAITQCRSLCLLAAVMADEVGFKEARKYIAIIKVQAPRQALQIVDEAIQLHGAAGLAQDSSLADMYMSLRTLRVADGPDAQHLNTIADMELARKPGLIGKRVSGENKNVAKYKHLWEPKL